MKEYKIKINGTDYEVAVKSIEDGIANVSVNGTEYIAEIEGTVKTPKTPKLVQKRVETAEPVATTASAAPVAKPAATGGTSIKSPLPGVILDVIVSVGDKVSVGQKLMILEAMKMENNIETDVAGTVQSIVKRKGDSVLEGDVLITIG